MIHLNIHSEAGHLISTDGPLRLGSHQVSSPPSRSSANFITTRAMTTTPEKAQHAMPVAATGKHRDPARPPKSSYSWMALLRTPGRIFCPPSVYETSTEIPTLGNKSVGGVRSTRRVQLKNVKLQDLIDGKHLPRSRSLYVPLSPALRRDWASRPSLQSGG